VTGALLAEAWRALSGDGVDTPPGAGALPAAARLTGPAEALASVFPVTQLGSAAVLASLLAAAQVQAVRSSGPLPAVELDTAHLACAVRSERYLSLNGQSFGGSFAPLSRFVRTADGWIRLHANYPWHRHALLHVLGTGADDLETVRAAVASWSGERLEDAIVEAGGCAAVVRGPDAWRAHPQGSIVERLPLLDSTPTGEAPPGLPPAGPLPASGIRVLDFTRVIAGPVTTRTLAAHGAEVLRIDAPQLPESPIHALDSLVGKRSALLDLRQSADRQRLEDLLATAHVVVQGYRPGALGAFGLGPEALSERYPGLVVLSLSAWGPAGPWAGRRGFDSLVQAASGIAVCEAEGADEPGVLPAQLLDHATGYLGAAAVLLALAQRQQVGRSWHIRLSLAQTAAWLLRQPRRPKTTPPAIDPRPYLVELEAPDGRLTLVTPPGGLDGRPLAWPAPPPHYGADPPAWRAVPATGAAPGRA